MLCERAIDVRRAEIDGRQAVGEVAGWRPDYGAREAGECAQNSFR
jgi:hypothetical protein